jgi:aspartyl-tRNA(Asn)/glutamyl-tRNA(Gln) amidotransferase subunit B
MTALPIRPAQLRCLSNLTRRPYTPRSTPRACYITKWHSSRGLTTAPNLSPDAVPLRKHLKDEAKRKKAEAKASNNGTKKHKTDPRLEKWELTVGIEVHAELNTACKLFSNAPAVSAESNGLPNSHVALFDAAMPGAQPQFQHATLLPALRAAIALGRTDTRSRSTTSRSRKMEFWSLRPRTACQLLS